MTTKKIKTIAELLKILLEENVFIKDKQKEILESIKNNDLVSLCFKYICKEDKEIIEELKQRLNEEDFKYTIDITLKALKMSPYYDFKEEEIVNNLKILPNLKVRKTLKYFIKDPTETLWETLKNTLFQIDFDINNKNINLFFQSLITNEDFYKKCENNIKDFKKTLKKFCKNLADKEPNSKRLWFSKTLVHKLDNGKITNCETMFDFFETGNFLNSNFNMFDLDINSFIRSENELNDLIDFYLKEKFALKDFINDLSYLDSLVYQDKKFDKTKHLYLCHIINLYSRNNSSELTLDIDFKEKLINVIKNKTPRSVGMVFEKEINNIYNAKINRFKELLSFHFDDDLIERLRNNKQLLEISKKNELPKEVIYQLNYFKLWIDGENEKLYKKPTIKQINMNF